MKKGRKIICIECGTKNTLSYRNTNYNIHKNDDNVETLGYNEMSVGSFMLI